MMAGWTGPWQIIKILELVLLTVKSSWLTLRGIQEVTKPVVPDKVKSYHRDEEVPRCDTQPGEIEMPP